MKKIIRTICLFADEITNQDIEKLDKISQILVEKSFSIQTKRVCSPSISKIVELDLKYASDDYIFGVGSLSVEEVHINLNFLVASKAARFNFDWAGEQIIESDV